MGVAQSVSKELSHIVSRYVTMVTMNIITPIIAIHIMYTLCLYLFQTSSHTEGYMNESLLHLHIDIVHVFVGCCLATRGVRGLLWLRDGCG